MFVSLQWPAVQFSFDKLPWLLFACEFRYKNAAGQVEFAKKNLTTTELCAMFGVSSGEELLTRVPSIQGFRDSIRVGSFAEFERRCIVQAVQERPSMTFRSGQRLAQVFSEYYSAPAEKRARGPADPSEVIQQKRFRAHPHQHQALRPRKRQRVHMNLEKLEDQQTRNLRAQEYAARRRLLEPFQPNSELIHSKHVFGNSHCLLETFHMASRLQVPTVNDMERAVEHFGVDEVNLTRALGYNMRTLRLAIAAVSERGEMPVIVIKTLTKPRGGWSWSALGQLAHTPGVYMLLCMINDPARDRRLAPAPHFVVFDTFTGQFGDSLAPSILNLDIDSLQAASRQYRACSIRAVTQVFQLMKPKE